LLPWWDGGLARLKDSPARHRRTRVHAGPGPAVRTGEEPEHYPVQEKNPAGEVHEDVGLFSFDKARKKIVFRQFHTEGFVNQYVADGDAKAGTLVFTTEAIENIPAGWRARETYILTGTDQLEEVFELAPPGKDFELYSRNRLTRVK
jgi:hypothetical protein